MTETRDPSSSSRSASASDSGPVCEPEQLLATGARIELSDGEWIVERVLGQGGMGVVYLVRDPRLGRRAALKVLRGPASDERVTRFRREGAITAQLDHPGIPPVFGAGQALCGRDYLLLRYVPGVSLAERLEELEAARHEAGADLPPPGDLLQALVEVGKTVAYAHARGVVHRDLKPDNVMLGAHGEVLVMDWGLALDPQEGQQGKDTVGSIALAAGPTQVVDETPSRGLKRPRPLVGTLRYMAPEQARREAVDARADVFALGAILGELISGEAPFVGSDVVGLLEATRQGDVRYPSELVPGAAPELLAIASKALDPDPARRYRDAGEFTADLDAYLRGDRVSAYTPSAKELLWRLFGRSAVALAAAALGASLLIGAGAAARAWLDEPGEKRAEESPGPRQTSSLPA